MPSSVPSSPRRDKARKQTLLCPLPPSERKLYKQKRLDFHGKTDTSTVSKKKVRQEIIDLTLDDDEDDRKPGAVVENKRNFETPVITVVHNGHSPQSKAGKNYHIMSKDSSSEMTPAKPTIDNAASKKSSSVPVVTVSKDDVSKPVIAQNLSTRKVRSKRSAPFPRMSVAAKSYESDSTTDSDVTPEPQQRSNWIDNLSEEAFGKNVAPEKPAIVEAASKESSSAHVITVSKHDVSKPVTAQDLSSGKVQSKYSTSSTGKRPAAKSSESVDSTTDSDSTPESQRHSNWIDHNSEEQLEKDVVPAKPAIFDAANKKSSSERAVTVLPLGRESPVTQPFKPPNQDVQSPGKSTKQEVSPPDILELESRFGCQKPDDVSLTTYYRRLREAAGLRKPPKVADCYTPKEYLDEFIGLAKDQGYGTEDFEHSAAVTKANTAVHKEDSKEQGKAQYGRTMFLSAQRVFEIGRLGPDKVFVDIGHGVGNLLFQAAYTIGCESRGIELVNERMKISEEIQNFFQEKHEKYSVRDSKERRVGVIRQRHGRLEESDQRFFLTNNVDLMFCNNFNGVFGTRSSSASKVTYTLDDYIAGLFTQLKEGAKLITLFEISRLPLPLPDANESRKKNGLEPSNQASFYTMEIIEDDGGADKLSFTRKNFKYYVYTRVGDPTFLCDNPNCDGAKANRPIDASTILISDAKTVGPAFEERLVSAVDCPHCDQRHRLKRERASVKRYGYVE